MDVTVYQDPDGNEPFENWLSSIKDKRTVARIENRLKHVRLGNLGDREPAGGGVHELRLHFGPGYRIYFGFLGRAEILLLSGGDKGSQGRDIQKAKVYWEEHQDRSK